MSAQLETKAILQSDDPRLRILILIAGLALVFAVAGVDRLSGPEVTVSVLYVIPIVICSYYAGLGAGLLASVASIIGYIYTAQSHADPASVMPVTYWNVVVRLLFFVAVAYVLARRRTAEERLSRSEERSRVYAQLHEIDRAILAVNTAEAIAKEALDGLKLMIPFEAASVVVFNSDVSEAQILACHSETGDPVGRERIVPLEETEETLSLQRGNVTSGDPLTPAASNFSLRCLLPFRDVSYYVNIPLLSQGKLVGALNLAASSQNVLQSKHIPIASQVADQLAIAIHNSRLFEDLRAAHDRLQTLSQTLLRVQETEKHHLARELHDELGQTLTALQIQLEDISGSSDAVVAEKLQQSVLIVDNILEKIRNISLDLRPLILDDLGLVAAVRWYLSRTSQLAGFTVHFESHIADHDLTPELETSLFRIIQEALTNILRHARATRVTLEIAVADRKVTLLVKDNGVGFDMRIAEQRAQKHQSLGILGMRERVGLLGGKLDIESVPSHGTIIRVAIPLKSNPAEVPI